MLGQRGAHGRITAMMAGPADLGRAIQDWAEAWSLAVVALFTGALLARDAPRPCAPRWPSTASPSGNLPWCLGPGAGDPLGSDVVLGTAAVRGLFGSRLAAVYAPEVLAGFGTGPARIDVRIVAPDGSAA